MPTITTPPPSTLSLPSDTELDTNNIDENNTMKPPKSPLYLIVATALRPPMGIGLRGELPWPALKKDMAFFRRVTSGSVASENAVIMGRRTWESIPPRFRPLKGRVNVVVTRDVAGFVGSQSVGKDGSEDVVAVKGLREAVEVLARRRRDGAGGNPGKTFVIGGSQIYRAAMMGEEDLGEGVRLRILQTLVRRGDGGEIECDTFFPVSLGEDGGEVEGGWKRTSEEEVKEWVDGESVPGGDGSWATDGEMEIKVVGWERTTGA